MLLDFSDELKFNELSNVIYIRSDGKKGFGLSPQVEHQNVPNNHDEDIVRSPRQSLWSYTTIIILLWFLYYNYYITAVIPFIS